VAATTKSSFYDYLKSREKQARLSLLGDLRSRGVGFPLSLADDILCLDLSRDERLAIMQCATSEDSPLDLEHFLTANLHVWDQELAAAAIREWAQRTPKFLWFRFLPLASGEPLPQRLEYTILDLCWHTGGGFYSIAFWTVTASKNCPRPSTPYSFIAACSGSVKAVEPQNLHSPLPPA